MPFVVLIVLYMWCCVTLVVMCVSSYVYIVFHFLNPSPLSPQEAFFLLVVRHCKQSFILN